MRLSRLYTEQSLPIGAEITLDGRAARYLHNALRLREGQAVVLFNGDGHDVRGRLTRCDRRTCRVQLESIIATEAPASLRIHLGVGISRGERMDLSIQKSVELGVAAITPLLTERSVVQLKPDRLAHRMAHWQGIITSACEQSGRSRLPSLHTPCRLADWLADNPSGLMLHHKAGATFTSLDTRSDEVNLLIGPEGGLSDTERNQAISAGYIGVRMGPRIMRTETAPIAALAVIQTLWGDFR